MSLLSRLIGQGMRRASEPYLELGDDAATVPAPAPHPGRQDLLYVHVPFCESLCPFCPFHRVFLDEQLAARYFAALREELRRYHEQGFGFGSVYVGGGTPTVLPDELIETLELIRALFGVGEISIETNPNHLVPAILEPLRAAGVNRLSVGVQSFDDVLLREIGRYHAYGSSAQIRERLGALSGLFDTLNVDMIFNFPHQSLASLDADLEILQDLAVDQVSYYPLMPVNGRRGTSARSLGTITYEREPKFYRRILERLSDAYTASSVWCFSRSRGMIDEYIVDQDNYVGVGSGAFSYMDGVFHSTTFSIEEYCHRVEAGATGVVAGKRYSPVEQMRYDFLVRLFGMYLDGEWMTAKYGADWQRTLWQELLGFRLLGALARDKTGFRLRRRGMYYWLVMMREFLSGVNRFRETMRSKAVSGRVQQGGASLVAPRSGG